MSPDDSSPTRTIPISGVTSHRPRRAKPASLRVALSAPHRLFFAGGALQLVLATAWWLFDLLGRYAGLAPVVGWSVPAPTAHAFLFQYTIFPFFMFGFLLTAVANWTGISPRRRGYVAAGIGMIAGAIAFQIGLALDARIALAALVLFGAGWAAGVVELARIAILNRGRDRYAVGVTVLMSVGLAGVVAFGLSQLFPVALLAWVGRIGGVWLFLLPVFLVINHRLVPFFSSRVIEQYALFRPQWSIPGVLVACALHAALDYADARAWLWLADLPLAAWVGYLALRWGLRSSFRSKLLVMLHLSLSMLAIGLALSTVQSIAALAGIFILGHAPLHVITLGYFAAGAIGMVSRVSLGHSGRALEADPLTWRLFLATLGVAGLRAAADLPGVEAQARAVILAIAAAALLAIAFGWAGRYLPMYLRPRADDKPG